MTLAGKMALVTGSRRSIGRGIVQALAEAGCDVGVNDLEHDADVEQTLRLVGQQGRKAEFFQADISDSKQVASMFDAFLRRFGRIDVLVNNPYYTEHRRFLEITEENWDRTMDVCLKGFFLCSQQAAQAMVAHLQSLGGSHTLDDFAGHRGERTCDSQALGKNATHRAALHRTAVRSGIAASDAQYDCRDGG